jgi:hypothetical protein
MREVSDAFLLNMAEVPAGLIGLFLVGMFFYVETGFRQLGPVRWVVESYFRASTRIVMLLFAVPLALSLTLVVLETVWTAVLFGIMSVALVVANVDTAIQILAVHRVTRSTAMLANEVLGSIGVVFIVLLPWVLGGIDPTREDFTWAILVSFASAFLSLMTVVLSVFDLARMRAQE